MIVEEITTNLENKKIKIQLLLIIMKDLLEGKNLSLTITLSF